ncbi:MAG: nitronate monooxygenase, partial [Burkholderiaceae bacterium]|nr:nitronate monooxygenase [Burkholderiaceae bacterium]
SAVRPCCEPVGYLLEDGKCGYITSYLREKALQPDERKIFVKDKTCLCTYMRTYNLWTCGHYAYRLKDTTRKLPDGTYQTLSAEHIFRDYQFSTDQQIKLPDLI